MSSKVDLTGLHFISDVALALRHAETMHEEQTRVCHSSTPTDNDQLIYISLAASPAVQANERL
jgi:hypothetical protein